MSDVDKPNPDQVRSPAEFVDALRKLKAWTGLAVRELEKRASAAGHRLPRSTLTAALARESLPRQEIVEAFVRACGGDEAEVKRWVAIRRTLATHGTTAPQAQAQAQTQTQAQAQPPQTTRRRRWLVAAAAMVLMLGTVGATLISSDPHEIPAEGAPVTASARHGQETGLLRREHEYETHCHMDAGGERWLLIYVKTTKIVGFVEAALLPETATPACAQTGEPVGVTASEIWQHPKPDAWSQHTGTIRTGTGRAEDLRWYLLRSGVPYHGSDGYTAVMDLAADEPVIGFISCTDTTVGCSPTNPR